MNIDFIAGYVAGILVSLLIEWDFIAGYVAGILVSLLIEWVGFRK